MEQSEAAPPAAKRSRCSRSTLNSSAVSSRRSTLEFEAAAAAEPIPIAAQITLLQKADASPPLPEALATATAPSQPIEHLVEHSTPVSAVEIVDLRQEKTFCESPPVESAEKPEPPNLPPPAVVCSSEGIRIRIIQSPPPPVRSAPDILLAPEAASTEAPAALTTQPAPAKLRIKVIYLCTRTYPYNTGTILCLDFGTILCIC